MTETVQSETELEEIFHGSERDQARVEFTVGHIPDGVRSGLEIGFSDGRMSRAIRKRIGTLYGLDLVHPIKDSTTEKRMFATVSNIPLADRSVDMVTCCEVLEHLDSATFHSALREVSRVARDYLLITVPYRQRVQNELTRCSGCGYIGHYSSHLRYFGEDSLDASLAEWECQAAVPFGTGTREYAPDWLYRARFALGAYLPRRWPCDGCEKTCEQTQPSMAGRLIQSLVWRIENRRPTRPTWLLYLWKRRATGTAA